MDRWITKSSMGSKNPDQQSNWILTVLSGLWIRGSTTSWLNIAISKNRTIWRRQSRRNKAVRNWFNRRNKRQCNHTKCKISARVTKTLWQKYSTPITKARGLSTTTNPEERWTTQTTQSMGRTLHREDSNRTRHIRVDDSRWNTCKEHLAYQPAQKILQLSTTDYTQVLREIKQRLFKKNNFKYEPCPTDRTNP